MCCWSPRPGPGVAGLRGQGRGQVLLVPEARGRCCWSPRPGSGPGVAGPRGQGQVLLVPEARAGARCCWSQGPGPGVAGPRGQSQVLLVPEARAGAKALLVGPQQILQVGSWQSGGEGEKVGRSVQINWLYCSRHPAQCCLYCERMNYSRITKWLARQTKLAQTQVRT